MKLMSCYITILLLMIAGCENDALLNPSDEISSLPVMEFYIDDEDLLALRSNKANSLDVPVRVVYKNKSYLGMVQAQGAGSRLHPKWAYKIELYDGETIEGLSVFNLSAQVFDKTLLKTTLTSAIYKELGFPTFKSKHVFLKINNRDQGLYPIIERIEQPFFNRRNLPVAELFKLGFDSKFTFAEPYNPQFYFSKEIPDDENYNTLIEFIHALDTCRSDDIYSSLSRWLDVHNYLKYHAVTSLINNFDAFRNNFLLHRESGLSPFKIIPWDFDKSFFHKDEVGIYGENEIILKLFRNEQAVEEYKNNLKYLLSTLFTEEYIFPIIDSTASVIREGYNIDPYLGAGRYNFDEEISILKQYISGRRQFFINNIDSFEGE